MGDSARSLGRSALAIVVLVLAVAIALKLLVGAVAGVLGFLFWIVVVGAIAAAVIWAVRILF
ncbi:MAG: hypothetical protein U0R70_07775 [Solirubrobacteraceae bacterium]